MYLRYGLTMDRESQHVILTSPAHSLATSTYSLISCQLTIRFKRSVFLGNWLSATLAFTFGLIFLIAGGELLVRGASRLAAIMKISPLAIGLTVVAFGTSSPELAVSIQSAFSNNADLALGNVVGSNIFNVLFILGISALITPLVVDSRLIRWDLPLMVGISVALLLLSMDRRISRLDGLIFFLGLITYIYWCVRQSRRESNTASGVLAEIASDDRTDKFTVAAQLFLVTAGLGLLGVGSHLLVGGSVFVAEKLGVSELIIGLTVVATGTSLPEIVTSIVAALRGEREIAVGNVVGSNIFNILGVLGLSSVLSPTGISVPAAAIRFDIPVMIATAVACLPIFFTGNLIARWEGGVFFGYYIAYLTYLILVATQSGVTRTFESVMILFVLPLTAVTLVVCTVRAIRSRR
jgi:cation:H+ antiporter